MVETFSRQFMAIVTQIAGEEDPCVMDLELEGPVTAGAGPFCVGLNL